MHQTHHSAISATDGRSCGEKLQMRTLSLWKKPQKDDNSLFIQTEGPNLPKLQATTPNSLQKVSLKDGAG